MENVTIILDDDLARRARVAADEQGKSLADLVRDVLVERLGTANPQYEGLRKLMSIPLWDLTDKNGRLPSREEMYAERADQLFHRHERPALSKRRTDAAETASG